MRRGATPIRARRWQKIWDAPTLQITLSTCVMKRAVEAGGGRQAVQQEVRMEREGAPTAHLHVSVQPVHGRRRKGHLSAVRGARHHRPQGRAGAASPKPEDGGARPADRRDRARLQQSADGRRWRARHHRQARRGAEAQALCRECAGRGRARGAADGPAAGIQPCPAPRGAPDASSRR